ncbi:ABC transporter ATP-binding protein [Ferruginibacter paludis]|uniref:ABC transporter ATP-binding protein n=1 Tax=Ferruginibacter paludis TaxID=1310417 RepID=UPI0025B3A158|nr:ABC transporter ATP-binding protein [Ferruginibacter paludis]MDN3658536.1 ABC transporter ATP-binding protein [Ferruginibacter paludis]
MIKPLLQVQNLSVSFTSEASVNCAVQNISFTVDAGEILAIVGESGSGKSVTALSLLQLLPQQALVEGKLLFATANQQAVDLLQTSGRQMNSIRGKDIAMIFQEPMTSLNPVITCGRQVMESIQLHQHISANAARHKTIELLQQVELPNPTELIDRYPHQLSGGQKQRVMIAMAMSCNPSLLIADEPTTALDVTVQKTILELIKNLQQKTGMGVIFITHDLGIVADIADSILVLYKGQIVEQGTTNQVLQHPQQPYTKALLACRPALHKHGVKLPVVSDFFDGNENNHAHVKKTLVTSEIDEHKTLLNADNQIADNAVLTPVLNVEKLSVHYSVNRSFLFGKPTQPFKAVDEVSFNVSKGETLGLVGESGCGKTTLGRAILQLTPVTSGSIILNGSNLASLSSNELRPLRKELQMVFQDPYGSLNPRITIGNAMTEPMNVHGILNSKGQRKERVVDLLEKVNLTAEHFNRYPHQFSGGQRQRICIARALVLNPSFLIFDESVSALDVSVQAQVLNLLNDLKKEFGFTSIFISHDLSVVRYISDRILVMNKGKIVEEGPADEVYTNPRNDYTKKLIAAVPGKSIVF